MPSIIAVASIFSPQFVLENSVGGPYGEFNLNTLFNVSAVALIVVATAYTVITALRHNDRANRILCASFIMASTALAIPSIWGSAADAPALTTSATLASSVYAVTLMWSGVRALDNKRPWLSLALLAAATTGTVAFLGDSASAHGDGDLLAFIFLALFAGAAGAALYTGSLRTNLNSRLLYVSLWIFGLVYTVLAGILTGLRLQGIRNSDSLSASVTALLFLSLFLMAAVSLSALRAERHGAWRSGDGAFDELRSELDVINRTRFKRDACDRLNRMSHVGGYATLVVTEINNLKELNTAFGHEFGDTAITHFIDVLRAKVPAEALIGHLESGRFAVMAMSRSPEHAHDIATAITTGLLNADVKPASEIRLGASFGSANTWANPASYDELLQVAVDDLVSSRT